MKDQNKSQARFMVVFIVLFICFYYFNIGFWSLVTPGNHYNPFLAEHFNYIVGLRSLLVVLSSKILSILGFVVVHNADQILVPGCGVIRISYSCLGLGVESFFAAFVIAYPKPLKPKLIFLISGVFGIELLNLVRCIILALYLGKSKQHLINHHTIFNVFIYIVISISLYFWIKEPRAHKKHAAN